MRRSASLRHCLPLILRGCLSLTERCSYDLLHDCDQVAVVYDKGQTPPEITIMQVSGFVHTVLADGIAVAVVACTSGPAPSAENVLLVERSS